MASMYEPGIPLRVSEARGDYLTNAELSYDGGK